MPAVLSWWQTTPPQLQSIQHPLCISPYVLTLVDPQALNDPILCQVAPHPAESVGNETADDLAHLKWDPLAETDFSPVAGLTHRYPDRAVMVATHQCATFCRHCFRKRITHGVNGASPDIEAMLDYLAKTPSIRDVLISGGDPLLLDPNTLHRILSRLKAIPHLEMIRIGTRLPAVLPQYIDAALASLLASYHPLWVNVQFNHPHECTSAAAKACATLLQEGIPLNNQSVLLRGINDRPEILLELSHALLAMRVRPYYLHQCDLVYGSEHFRTSLQAGIAIIKSMRGFTTGLAIPTYTMEAPDGRGKVAILEALEHYDPESGSATLRDYRGHPFVYQDPRYTVSP